VIVLEKAPATLLVALFVRGFWLEVRRADDGTVLARYVYGEKQVARVLVGLA
jgi:hypothetical protein